MNNVSDSLRFRCADSETDADKLRDLYADAFPDGDVAGLAVVFFHKLPHMDRKYWLMVEDAATGKVVSAVALIPWVWEMDGVSLQIAEMGLVGTRPAYRRRGLLARLNREFDRVLTDEGFDLAVIQGIPGFYHRFGYHYALPMENHVNLPFHAIPDPDESESPLRSAGVNDIPFFTAADDAYRRRYFISARRDENDWRYLLSDSKKTEYGADFYLLKPAGDAEPVYCRVMHAGFGKGLNVSEISESITVSAAVSLFSHLKAVARRRNKPFIRLNLHGDSPAVQAAIALGAEAGAPYGWQVKIPNHAEMLRKMAPVFETRLTGSPFAGLSNTLRLDFFTSRLDLVFESGRLAGVREEPEGECERVFCVPPDLFPPLCLGRHSRRTLSRCRPDIFPATRYIAPHTNPASDTTGLLVDTLFPETRAWIYGRY